MVAMTAMQGTAYKAMTDGVFDKSALLWQMLYSNFLAAALGAVIYDVIFLYLPVSAIAWWLVQRRLRRPIAFGLLNSLPYMVHAMALTLIMAGGLHFNGISPLFYGACALVLFNFLRGWRLAGRAIRPLDAPTEDEIFA